MGRGSRPKPLRLAEKLIEIRHALGLSQNGVIEKMKMTEEVIREDISAFERGIREPPLPILLKYAQTAGVYVDALIDDNVDLPNKLPHEAKHEGVPRKQISKGKNKH